MIKKCDYCGKEYKIYLSRIKKYNFCSKKCYGKWRSENIIGKNHPNYNSIEIICDYCNKKIEVQPKKINRNNNNFCNRKCYSNWMSINQCKENNPNYKEIEILTCKNCGKEFEVYPFEKEKRIFCSQECNKKYKLVKKRQIGKVVLLQIMINLELLLNINNGERVYLKEIIILVRYVINIVVI